MKVFTVAGAAVAVALVLRSAAAQAPAPCGGLLYATGFDDRAFAGDKAALLAAAEAGTPLRVRWDLDFDDDGVGDLSHWADAAFVSIFEGEVFTQVAAIQRQRPLRGDADIRLAAAYVEWRGSLGSNGRFEGVDADGNAFPENVPVAIHWCDGRSDAESWTAVYAHDTNGARLSGSIEALHAAIRAGRAIRIGWGGRYDRDGAEPISVEHVISPVFLTIMNGEQVAAQLPEHLAQRSYWEVDEAFFEDAAVLWRGLMTTKGTFDAVWTHRGTGEEVRRWPQRAALTWYAQGPAPVATPTLAKPGGVMRDEAREDERKP